MFSFPNKERRLARIRDSAASGSRVVSRQADQKRASVFTIEDLSENERGDTSTVTGSAGPIVTLTWSRTNGGSEDTTSSLSDLTINSLGVSSEQGLGIMREVTETSGGSDVGDEIVADVRGESKSSEKGKKMISATLDDPLGCCPIGFMKGKSIVSVTDTVPDSPTIITNNGHVTVNLNEEDNVQRKADQRPSTYLITYLNMMYSFGVSTYGAHNHENADKEWRQLVSDMMAKTLFWYLSCQSLFYSICQAKFCFLQFQSGVGYNVFVQMIFHIACLSAKIYGINLFVSGQKKTDKMLRTMEQFEDNYPCEEHTSTWKWKLVRVLAVISLVLALTTAVFGMGFANWSIEDLILANSNELSEDIFMWNSANFQNTSSELTTKYGTNVTSTTIAFGTMVVMRNFASYLQIGVMLDLILVVSYVMYLIVMPFTKQVEDINENDSDQSQLQSRREALWSMFRDVQTVVKEINVVFGPLLKLMHVQNLLMYAFFLELFIFNHKTRGIITVLYAYNIFKAEIAYFIAGKIAETNDKIRTWIQNWGLRTGKIRIGEEEMDGNFVLDKLKTNPIGFGDGNSRINQTFHFKLLGLLSSLFFSLAGDYAA